MMRKNKRKTTVDKKEAKPKKSKLKKSPNKLENCISENYFYK